MWRWWGRMLAYQTVRTLLLLVLGGGLVWAVGTCIQTYRATGQVSDLALAAAVVCAGGLWGARGLIRDRSS
jgi:hypothetical protein